MATTGIKFAHSAHISPKGKPTSSQSQMWAMLTAGLACGFLGMYFTITRPMSARLELLESDLVMMQTEMHQLVGTRDELWKTNDLLSGLRQQQRQLGEAELALESLRQMKNEVISLNAEHAQAMSSLRDIAALQQELAVRQAELVQSQAAVKEMESLHVAVQDLADSAISRKAEVIAASDSLSQLDQLTGQTLVQLNQLTGSTLAQAEKVAQAQSVINSVDKLAGSLIARHDPLAQSTAVVQQIDLLNDRIAAQGSKIPAATESLEQLITLEDRLHSHDPNRTIQASTNLAAMKLLETELAAGSNQITAAIQTVELLEDFQKEMERQALTLTNMRRDLMEITFLESTVQQTLNVLKPLIQLTDMRRMTNQEVREAARVIIDRRIATQPEGIDGTAPSQVAEREISSPKMYPAAEVETQKVPDPTDLK